MSNFYSVRKHKASFGDRKCALCGEVIPLGEEYERHVYRYAGDFHSEDFHLSCADVLYAWGDHECGFFEWDSWAIKDWMKEVVCSSCFVQDCSINVLRCPKFLDRWSKESSSL